MPVANNAHPPAKLTALPVINLSPFIKPEDGKGRLSAAAQLHAACLEYGFFYLDISSYIDPEEPEELTRLAREFFALPEEEKDRIALRHEDRARGTSCILVEGVHRTDYFIKAMLDSGRTSRMD